MVKIITCPSGDWTIVEVDGEPVTSGHTVSKNDLVNVLRYLGHGVEEVEISDAEMEERS